MKTLNHKLKLFFLTAAIFSFACSPIKVKSGAPINMSQLSTIEKGLTGKNKIKELFGQAQMTGIDDDGLEVWTYIYIKASVPLRGDAVKEEFQRLSITFMENGTVKSFSYETSK